LFACVGGPHIEVLPPIVDIEVPLLISDIEVLLLISDMTPSFVKHDSFTRMTFLIHACDMIHSHTRSFAHATRPIHARDMTYGVATISRLPKMIGLFCKRGLYKRRYSAKETYNFKEPTNRSHLIPTCETWCWWVCYDPFIRVTWLKHTCEFVASLQVLCVGVWNMTHLYVRHASNIQGGDDA